MRAIKEWQHFSSINALDDHIHKCNKKNEKIRCLYKIPTVSNVSSLEKVSFREVV